MVARRPLVRGDVHLVQLEPTRGREIQKTRPCVIVSPDDINDHLQTVVVAPMTTVARDYPWWVACRFQNRSGFVAVDQLRTVDGGRLIQRLGKLSSDTTEQVLVRLQEMFSE